MPALRRTKIVATIGPASDTIETLRALVEAGLDVARLNFSHGTHDDHRRAVDLLRRVEQDLGTPIGILQDLQGPKIRLGEVEGIVDLEAGSEVILSGAVDFVGTKLRLPTTYGALGRDVKPGEPVLLADGSVVLEVTRAQDDELVCRVLVGGKVSSRKGLNLPGSNLSTPSLPDKDRRDLKLGLELGVDFVALSFVRHPSDVQELREEMGRLGRVVPIISKVEKPQAVERIEAILGESDGVMVARGDLGVELPSEAVPGVQRRVIRLARKHGKVAIVATQMLVSMTESPRPSHAEVSDVANAVLDGTDAVMLSEETAAGKFPVEAVQTMAKIVSRADHADPGAEPLIGFAPELQNTYEGTISRAAVATANDLGAAAIVSFTDHGTGPRLLANWRPRARIVGCASAPWSTRRMSLYWGVTPLLIRPPSSFEDLVRRVEEAAVLKNAAKTGATVVLTTKLPVSDKDAKTNVLKLHTIGAGLRSPPDGG